MGSNPIRHPNKKEVAKASFFCALWGEKPGFVIDEVACFSKNPIRHPNKKEVAKTSFFVFLEHSFYFESECLYVSALVHPDEFGDIIATAFCLFDNHFQQIRVWHRST